MNDLTLYLFAAFAVQNLVLTTGFGSSLMLRIVRRPREMAGFSLLLTVFAVLTVLGAYPVDGLISRQLGTSTLIQMLRPLAVVAVVIVIYIFIVLVTRIFLRRLYKHINRLLGLAAFNNLTVGVALIAEHNLALNLLQSIGLAVGAGLGFFLLSWLTIEARDRAENPDVPPSFRGLPVTLLYLGILGMALMGFGKGSLI